MFGWQYFNNLGGAIDDARDIAICADGGFFVTGRSNAWALGGFASNWYDYEMFLIKLDSLGNHLWTRHYGELGDGFYDAAWTVCATDDSGAIMAGKTQSPRWTTPPYYDNALVVRVDKNGDTLWTRTFGGNRFDRFWWIKQVPGIEEYFLAGPTASYGPGMPSTTSENIWIIRINGNGDLLHEGIWAPETRAGNTDVRWGELTPDGGCIVVGSTDLRDTTYYYADYDSNVTHRISRMVIVKADAECNIEWSKIYDTGCSDHYSRSITAAHGGGYLATTYNKWPAWTWCLRLDEFGDTLWTGYVGLDPYDPTIRLANYNMVVKAPDGYYFAGGGQGWAWITKTDANLNELWSAPFDLGSYSETFLSCKVTSDGGCVACGETYSVYPTSYSDVFVARVSRFGDDWYNVRETAPELPVAPEIAVYPNPFNASVTVEISGVDIANCRIEVYDLSGKHVDDLAPGASVWRPSHEMPSGTYLFRVSTEAGVFTKKAVFLK
jgi:hypothetical protein